MMWLMPAVLAHVGMVTESDRLQIGKEANYLLHDSSSVDVIVGSAGRIRFNETTKSLSI
jgi:hypothetical protein